jgi:hypothetical protein
MNLGRHSAPPRINARFGVRSISIVVLLFLAAGCLEDNSLSGSMSEVFPLEVSRVSIFKNDEAMNVTFFRNRNIYLDVVASLTVALRIPDGGISADGGIYHVVRPGFRMNLQGEYALGHPIATVIHAPGGEPSRRLPFVNRGDLSISGGGQPGEEMSGDFSMSFQDRGGDIGFGRTLSGRFRAVAVDAGFGDPP